MKNSLMTLKRVTFILLGSVLISGFGGCGRTETRDPDVILSAGAEHLLYQKGKCIRTSDNKTVPCYEGGIMMSTSEWIRILDLINANCPN